MPQTRAGQVAQKGVGWAAMETTHGMVMHIVFLATDYARHSSGQLRHVHGGDYLA